MEAAIRDHIIPALLKVTPADVNDKIHNPPMHGIKAGRMNLRNPVADADRLFQASKETLEVLAALLLGTADLDSI